MNYIVLGVLTLVLLICTYTDLKERKIYNVITLSAIALIVVIRIFHHPQGVVFYFWGIIPAVALLVSAVISKGKSTGGGDILLVLFVGITIGGVGSVISLVYAFALAAIIAAIAFTAANKKVGTIPLAPYLTIGVVAFYLQPYWLVPILY